MRSASSSRASKKILTFFAATLLLIPSLAGQSRMYKDADAVRKAVAKASRKAEKSRHASDWMKLAEVSEDACLFPLSNLVPGEGNSIRTLVVKGQRPREIMAETALPGIYRNIYTDKDIYFDADGNLVAIRVTRPVEDMDELMDRRREAYVRAYELDGKAIYTKSIAEGLSRLATEYRTLGQTADRLGEPERARELYLRSAAVSMTKPCAEPDTLAMRVYFQEQQRKEAEELERMRLEERKRQAYVIFSQGEQLYQEAMAILDEVRMLPPGRDLEVQQLKDAFAEKLRAAARPLRESCSLTDNFSVREKAGALLRQIALFFSVESIDDLGD